MPVLTRTSCALNCQKIKEAKEKLFNAIISGDSAKVNEYISSGMDMNFCLYGYITPLELAAHIQHVEICQMLISQGVKLNFHILKEFLMNNAHQTHCLKGRSRESRHSLCLNFWLSDYSFPLYNPPKDARCKILKLLLTNASFCAENINRRESNRYMFIHESLLQVSTDHLLIQETKLLLEAGANPNLEDSRIGVTPLHIAVRKGNFELCKMLLDYGADMDIDTAINKKTPFDLCTNKQIKDYMIQLKTFRSEMRRAHPDEDDDNCNDDDNQDDDGEEELNSVVRSGVKRAHPDEDEETY